MVFLANEFFTQPKFSLREPPKLRSDKSFRHLQRRMASALVKVERQLLMLPLLKLQPEPEQLLTALTALAVPPPSWDGPAQEDEDEDEDKGRPPGEVAHWLTRLIGNELQWIEEEDMRDHIWSLASKRLAERCGRAGPPPPPPPGQQATSSHT